MHFATTLALAAASFLGPQATSAMVLGDRAPSNETLLVYRATGGPGTIQLIDTATQGGCTGSTCCIPTCKVNVLGVFGCTGSVEWTGTCFEQHGHGTISQKVQGCSGRTMQWVTPATEGGNSYIRVNCPSCDAYQGWPISGCHQVHTTGSQCVPSGGTNGNGCTVG